MASGYYSFVAGAKPLASEWNDYVSKQVVGVYASTAARDSALSGVLREGLFAYTSDTNRTMYYSGSAWLPVSGLWGCEALEATQSCPNGVNTAVVFDTESWDTDGYHSGTSANITIPSGLGGKYLMSARVSASTTLGGSGAAVTLIVDSATVSTSYIPAGFSGGGGAALVNVSAGQVCQLGIFNGHGSTINYFGLLSVTRICD
jgi:hypothetical protein